MKRLEIFDPALCCTSGVCGVDVDPALVQFQADLLWLAGQGVAVSRHNLAQEPQVFAANPAVLGEMQAGLERLPVTLVNGQVVATGAYPTRAELVRHLGLAPPAAAPADPFRIQVGSPSDACCKPGSGCC